MKEDFDINFRRELSSVFERQLLPIIYIKFVVKTERIESNNFAGSSLAEGLDIVGKNDYTYLPYRFSKLQPIF